MLCPKQGFVFLNSCSQNKFEGRYASEPDLPSITSRIQDLTPTCNVVDFYNAKIKACDHQLNVMMEKLEGYKLSHEHQLNLERRVRHIMDQNESLRQSLSTMRSHLFDETQNILQLKSENGQLKLQELSDHKKIHHLLMLLGITDEETVTLFLKRELPSSKIQEILLHNYHSACPSKESEIAPDTEIFALQTENDILNLRITALQAELNEKTELVLHEHDAFAEERHHMLCDFDMRKSNDAVLIEDLTQRLEQLQTSLHNHLKSFLTLRKTASVPDFKGRLLTSPTKQHQKVGTQQSPAEIDTEQEYILPPDTTKPACLISQQNIIKDLESQLQRSECSRKRQDRMIREFQAEISGLKKQGNENSEQPDKYKHLTERIQTLSSRNKGLERRRKLDYEGFKSDVKLLREQIRDVEKQILKLVIALGNQKEGVDLSALEVIENTKHGTAQIVTKLSNLNTRLSNM